MAEEKKKQNEGDDFDNGQSRNKPASNANSQPVPDNVANMANHKGAQDLGTDGTKATASQQQGQGAWSKKGNDNRTGSDKEQSGGQGGKNKTGAED